MTVQLVYATFPDEDSVQEIAERVLEQRLAACVTSWDAASRYVWEGEITEDQETLALFKTAPSKRDQLVEAIEEAHPYDVPCVLPLASEEPAEGYAAWIGEITHA